MPLDAEGTAAATSALYVRVVKFEARTFDGLDVIDLNAFEIHFAHLIDENFQAFKFIDIVAVLVDLILESHVVTEARATSANHGYAQASRCGSLLLKNLFNFCNCYWCKLNHSPSLHRFRTENHALQFQGHYIRFRRRAIGFPLLFVQETKRVNTVSLTFALGSALGTDPTDDVDWERFAA